MLLINLHHSWHYLSLKNWNPGYKLEPWLAGKIFICKKEKHMETNMINQPLVCWCVFQVGLSASSTSLHTTLPVIGHVLRDPTLRHLVRSVTDIDESHRRRIPHPHPHSLHILNKEHMFIFVLDFHLYYMKL